MAESNSGGTSGYETRAEGAKVTFAPVAAAQAQSTLSGASAGARIQGGQVTGGVVDNRQSAPPQGWGAVGDVVETLLQPKLKAAQQENFWQGVTAARAGQSVTDIVASQSPLTKIFGPSEYVRGAQFYTSQAKLADYNQNMIANADALARVPPAELGKRLNEESQKYMTGDPGTDMLTQQAWIEQTGPALAVITRTRFAQQQQAATEAFLTNANANAANLQKLSQRLGDATATRDDYNAQLKITAEAHMIPPGMTPETYRALLPKLAKDYADKGNFQAVTFLKQSGALSHMDVDQRTKLDDYIDRKEKNAATLYRYGIATELAIDAGALKSGAMTPAEWQRRTKARNEKFQRETGVTDTPLIPGTEQESMLTIGVTNWYEGQAKLAEQNRAAAAKAATQAEKDAVAARNAQQISTLIATGSVGESGLYGMDKQEVDASFIRAYETATPEQQDQLVIQNWKGSKYVNSTLQNRLSAGLRATVSADYSPAVDAVAASYERMVSTPDGAAAAAAYYASEDRVRMERFNMLKKAGQPAPVAFKVAFQDPLTDALDYTKTYGDDKEINNVIKDRFSTWFGNTADGKLPLDEFSQRLVGGLVNKNVRTMLANTGLSVAQAARQEVNNLSANGLEVYGSHAWTKQPNQNKLETYIRSEKNTGGFDYHAVPPAMLDKVFAAQVQEGMKSVGGDAESVQVIRIGDVKGVAQFYAFGFTKDGHTTPFYQFNSDDLSRRYEQSLKDRRKLADPLTPTSKRTKEPGLLAPGLPDNSSRFIEQAPDRIY